MKRTLKELRELNCMTQADVVEHIGGSRTNYSKIENRHQKPRLHYRKKLADLFKVKPSEIEF
jgi:DNA-binding XRE family transcriptional regulator